MRPRRWPRPLRVVLAVVVAAALAATTLVLGVRVTHPRDEAAFLRQVHGSVSENGVWVFDAVDDATLLAEGDGACTWLAEQRPALWRRGGEWSLNARLARYQREVPATSPRTWDLGEAHDPEIYRRMVVGAAWAELCGASTVLRGTHNPFNRPPHD